MRPYEIVIILDSALEESAVQAVINRTTATIDAGGGTLNGVDKWGRKRLAYPIAKKPDGFYVFIELTSEPAVVDEIDRNLRLADEVLRHKVIRVPDTAGGRTLPPEVAAALVTSGSRRDRDRDRDR